LLRCCSSLESSCTLVHSASRSSRALHLKKITSSLSLDLYSDCLAAALEKISLRKSAQSLLCDWLRSQSIKEVCLLYRYITRTEYIKYSIQFFGQILCNKTHKTCRALTYLSKL